MCGIAGFVGFDDEALLREMCASLAHRGPDASGFYTAPGVGLAHRRLSVIDLATGSQPMANEDGSIYVIFNGEIYNYESLTSELKRRGHVFSSTSDTEVIVHLYEDYGLSFVDHLRGMFAIGLWDAKNRRLVLARDRIGEKPLYYMQDGRTLLFASEIKAILQKNVTRAVNAQAVCEYLAANYVPAPRSFYQGISKLQPGHMLVHEDGEARVLRYWQRRVNGRSSLTLEEATGRLVDILTEATKLCLKSDVEVGAFLSGGIDSSIVVALMRQHSARLRTFTVGFGREARGYNELTFARRVATELGTQHYEIIADPHSSISLLPRLIWHFDEPNGNPTSYLVYLLSQFTRREVKVAVGGTGGDEIFFGYPRHQGIRYLHYYKLLPRILRQQVVERIVQKWPESTKGSHFAKRARRFVLGANLAPEDAYGSWVSLFHRDIRARLISDPVQLASDDPMGDCFLRGYLSGPESEELLDRAANLDVGAYLPEFQLTYMDRMSMAHGLEVRSPLVDAELVDFVTSLPASYRLRGLRSKHILKEAALRWIPKAIAQRRKMGFDAPVGQWMKAELREFMERFLSREQLERSGLLNPEAVAQVLGEHLSGKRDYSMQLWSLVTLECWYRMYIEGRVKSDADCQLKDLRGAPAGPWAPCVPRRAAADRPVPFEQPPSRGPAFWSRRHVWSAVPVAWRHLLAPLLRAMPTQMALGKHYRRWAKYVETSQFWPVQVAQEYCLENVRRICRLAYASSVFYRRLFDGVGFHPRELGSLADLRKLPLIDKHTIRQNLQEMCTKPCRLPGVDLVSTGGSDRAPLSFYIDADRSSIEYAHLNACWGRVGYTLGTPLAVLRGNVVKPDRTGLFHEYDPILKYHYYSAYHMTTANLSRYLNHISTIGPCFLLMYPSTANRLARFIERSGETVPTNVRGLLVGSENVYPDQRRFVERVLGVRCFSWYGHSEKLVLAAECEYSTDYHVWPTYGYLELLDERGNPVSTPGEEGEIVGTGFINTVVPFIRYRTGDYATYVGDHCEACGRQHTIICDIRGHRTQEMLVAADGSEISWTAMNMHDDTFLHVRQFQFRQDTPGRAVLRVVPAERFGDEDQRRIQQNLGRKLDGQVTFAIELVETIPLSPRGKAIYVDQRIPPRT